MVSKSKECLLPYYPNRKLLYAFNTARSSKPLEFPTTEEADCGLEVRKGNFFEGDSFARRASDWNEPQSVVIRGVPLELLDSTALTV